MSDRVEINEGDTVVITDSEGVQYTLHNVFVSNSDFDKFKTTDPDDDEGEEILVPVVDVTLSAFDFHIDSGLSESEEE